MNAMALILNADKVYPEPLTLELEDAELLEVVELHSRLTRIGQIVSELKKIAAADVAGKLGDQALNYGGTIYRASNGRGTAKVYDPDGFFSLLASGVERSEDPPALLASLFPASSVRLTALPKLAELLGFTAEGFKDTIIAYDPPSSPLSVMPLAKAPKHLQTLAEGEIR